MRFLPSLIPLCLAVGAVAQQPTFAGTKSDVIKTSTQSPAAMGFMPFFQLMVALGVVLLVLKFILPKFISKFNKRLITSGANGIKIEESAAFAGGNLYVVNARGKSLLLSVATTGVTCLADLTPVEQPKAELPTFLDILETASQEPEEVYPEPQPAQPEPHGEMLLEDVFQLLEAARGKQETVDVPQEAVIETEEVIFKTRLPENTKPLPPITPEPWQPRRVDREHASQLEDLLRRADQLSA